MPVQTLLDLSTGHVRQKDSELLAAYRADGGGPFNAALIAYPYEYGWTVSTSGVAAAKSEGHLDEKIASIRKEGFSEEFVALLLHAEEKGCSLVRLDQDADREPGLPYFEWAPDGNDVLLDDDDNEIEASAPNP